MIRGRIDLRRKTSGFERKNQTQVTLCLVCRNPKPIENTWMERFSKTRQQKKQTYCIRLYDLTGLQNSLR